MNLSKILKTHKLEKMFENLHNFLLQVFVKEEKFEINLV
jgi:hypothetical protein